LVVLLIVLELAGAAGEKTIPGKAARYRGCSGFRPGSAPEPGFYCLYGIAYTKIGMVLTMT